MKTKNQAATTDLCRCQETAAKVKGISQEMLFVLKLERLCYYANDNEIYHLLPLCGSDIPAQDFMMHLKSRGRHNSSGTTNSDARNNNRIDDTINTESHAVELFVPVRVRGVLFAYIIRIQPRQSTYIVFNTGWQLGWDKWKLSFRDKMNSRGWHSGLSEMYEMFHQELFYQLRHLSPLQSTENPFPVIVTKEEQPTSPTVTPPSYFDFTQFPLIISALSAGCPLSCMFIYDLLTREFPDYNKSIDIALFGSPRFASTQISQWFTAHSDQVHLYRFVNPYDPIPNFPTRKHGYCHLGTALITPDCHNKPVLSTWKWPSCHGKYFGVSFLSPTMESVSTCAEVFLQFWWAFLIVILLLLSILLIIMFTSPYRRTRRSRRQKNENQNKYKRVQK